MCTFPPNKRDEQYCRAGRREGCAQATRCTGHSPMSARPLLIRMAAELAARTCPSQCLEPGARYSG